jgi:hypothetical protein
MCQPLITPPVWPFSSQGLLGPGPHTASLPSENQTSRRQLSRLTTADELEAALAAIPRFGDQRTTLCMSTAAAAHPGSPLGPHYGAGPHWRSPERPL